MAAKQSAFLSTSSRKGFVLPTVVFAIALMSIVVVASLSTSSDERRASRAVRESILSVYTAEAGLRQTYGAWPSAPVKALNPGDSLDLGWQTLPNNEMYRAVIHRVDNGGLQEYNVVVQGRRTGLNGGVSTLIGVVGGVPLFNRAIYADTLVYLAGGGLIDSFDSQVGPYNPLTADSIADIATNKSLVVQKATVKGNIAAGGTITLGNSGVTVTGTKTAGAALIPPYDVIPCPATGYTPVSPELAVAGYTGNGVLNVAAGVTVNFSQPQYFFKSVNFAGNSKITVPGNPHVDLMVQDSIYSAGGTFVNSGHYAPDLSITACGTPTNPAKTNYWSITGGSDAYFSVYAPNRVVYGVGNSDFYGAVISSLFYISGGASVHYDAALARAPSPKLEVQKATWGLFPGG
ncbi:MAG: hypothetical protein DMD30_00245 [Gemmatimonadetes bacterium]|nr:MAG: hypothetical protein DMD30_00245 [Gemmatimonadota bacterium]